ncbi:MFS transporter [Hansschlegelia sp. KR7-227]|uniref:MFS transporter n=1 Tax=Hansschlegelia sp. KR7-227 TaxID=3400914 RepID=UPI003C0B04DA
MTNLCDANEVCELGLAPTARGEAPPFGAAPALFALSVGGLALGTGEFASMGLVPNVAADLGVTIPQSGHTISAYALGVVVGAPLLAVLFARAPKRELLIGLMIFFAIGNIASATAPGYLSLNIGRFLAGLPHGAYFGVAALVAAALAPPNKRAQAVGLVMLGLSVANVVGVPFATWLGQTFGWRYAFFAVAAIGAVDAALVFLFAPRIRVEAGASARRELAAFASLQVWLTLGVAAIGFGGMFAVYSYVAPTLTEVTGLQASTVPAMLAVIGLGMIAGNTVGGWLADQALKPALIGFLLWNVTALALFTVTSSNVWLATINLFAIGCGIAIGPAVQTRLMDVAADSQTLAAALNHSAFNLANALGAWLGGLAIAAGYGWTSLGWVGVALALGGLVILLVSFAVEKRASALSTA